MLEEKKENKKKNLGRGLEALLGEMNENILNDELGAVKSSDSIKIDQIKVSAFQPRKDFDEEAIKSLAASIKEKGVLQPLIVRPKDGEYELIAGERRLRASKEAGLTEVPVIVKELSDSEVLEIALIENLLRENLSAIEEANAYQSLMDKFSHTQERVASIVGKSRSYIANTLRLLSLPEKVKQLVCEGKLSAGHARCLVGLDNAEILADKIIKEDLNVRQVEELVSRKKEDKPQKEKKQPKSSDLSDIEENLKKALGLRIKITPSKQGGGKVVLQYASVAELDMIINILEQKKKAEINLQNTVFKAPEEKNEKFSIKFVE
ncbi:MAG: ParB/RepB/Spo0J family partition protein [bacterium]|nr:ParB/RepB/Spo0J family partition protein [bacterium]MDY2830379.1 ParB/RepB/Spo0J family partition protein [Alphaproteobacteria bacterium]